MKAFDSSFKSFNVKTVAGGWKKLSIAENFTNRDGSSLQIEVGAKHLSDGLLRLMSILAQTSANSNVLLFDEIENGINPEFIEILVELLMKIDTQVIVTTHSPLFLNFI